jgi:group I intron endonuclease
MAKKYGIVYKATNKINGKCYIGKTSRPLKKRIYQHIFVAAHNTSNSIFHRALRKYGVGNFKWEIIEKCESEEALNLAEELYIRQFNSYAPNKEGYNATYGGEGSAGRILGSETKIKMSLSSIGQIAWNRGLTKKSDRRVLNYSRKLTGEKHSNGRKKNQSIARKEWIEKHREKALEHLEKNCASKKAAEKRRKTVAEKGLRKGKNNGRYIKIDKDKFIELYDQGIKLIDIATFFNVGLGTIERRVKEYSFSKRKRNKVK